MITVCVVLVSKKLILMCHIVTCPKRIITKLYEFALDYIFLTEDKILRKYWLNTPLPKIY